MIKKNTLFVLGAGASKEFGFPVGLELTEMLCGRSNNHDNVRVGLQMCGYMEPKIHEFRNELYWSGRDSIDLFLESRKDLAEIGKCAIASALVPVESPGDVFKFRDNWYRILFAAMRGGRIDENRVSFVTFNYDRSLEHFLVQAVHKSTGVKVEEAAAQVRGIPIVHMYGTLGAYPGLGRDKEPERVYNGRMPVEDIRLAAGSIELMGERASNPARGEQISSLIRQAKRIIFLGFSFDQTNISNMKWPNRGDIDQAWVCATMYGLRTYERRMAETRLGGLNSKGEREEKCHDFLREHLELDD